MISCNEFSIHTQFTGISENDEKFIADYVYRHTGVPLSKYTRYGIDLVSLDTHRLIGIEVEGADPASWSRDKELPHNWKRASFVAKKLRFFCVWLNSGLPSIYIKTNHWLSQCYAVSGKDLVDRMGETGACVIRENRNTSLNQNRFIEFDWDDPRLVVGYNNIRKLVYGVLEASSQRKRKSPSQTFYLDPVEAIAFYNKRLDRTPPAISLAVTHNAPDGFFNDMPGISISGGFQ
jgi:hypothetical protein